MARKPTRSRRDNCTSRSTCCGNKFTNITPATKSYSTTTSSPATTTTSIPVAKSLLLLTIIACCLLPAYGYNIDLLNYRRFAKDYDSMFGFSIALHRAQNGEPSLIVGAPKFNTGENQTGIYQRGAVFRCRMTDSECGLVPFDSKPNNLNTLGDVVDRKSFQWLGATVATSRENDLVVACAPRYVFHTMTPKRLLRYDPVGTCFTSRDFSQFSEISPCRTNSWGYHRQGSCQAGFSAAANKKGDRVYIGAPGSWYWQGQAYSVSPNVVYPYKPNQYEPFGAQGQAYTYDLLRTENQVYLTSESSALDDDSYLGYSMVTGDFNADGIEDIAIGMPRGEGLLGKVVVNRWNMANLFNITGRQIGEYFGYAMAAGDIDGDGMDDLIIGAPMYADPKNIEGKYDVGRVYIHLQATKDESLRFTKIDMREGTATKGRFGLSLAYLGDINRDGYGDFAVGAPYDGVHGHGVVYIYHGSKAGPLKKPSQIIHAEDVVGTHPFPHTFGFALAGGLDMDGNTYPDLAVGAYNSSLVFVFRARPVAAVDAQTTFMKASKLIDIEDKRCHTVRDGKSVACTDIRTCWSYTGQKLPGNLEFDVSWVLDAKKQQSPRMFFLNYEGRNVRNMSIRLYYGQTYCLNETVYVINNIQDKLTPLEVETHYNLRNKRSVATNFEPLQPVIDENRELVQRDAINIQKNCGLDNICIPDLRLQIQTYDEYLLGSGKPLPIDVTITNRNEDAFEAAFYMTVPKDIEFKIVQQGNDTGVACTAPSAENNNTLKCDIGNPFPAKQVAKFSVILLPTEKVGMSSTYVFNCIANSTNEETAGTLYDNEITKEIPIWADTTLRIEGTSLPSTEIYKASNYKSVENATKEADLGPQVVHMYNIRNNGPSIVEEAVIEILYPHETTTGELLMYLLNQPETVGNVVCEPHITVNVLNLKWDENLRSKSYLEQVGASDHSQIGGSTSSSSGVIVESSGEHIQKAQESGTVSGSSVLLGGKYTPTVEDTKRLEKEDEQDSTGDASLIHSDRANQAAAAQAAQAAQHHNAAGSGSSWSSSSSWNSSNSDGHRPSSVVVTMRNSTTYYDPSGQSHKVETSTEYVTSLEHGPGNYNQQQHSANYQQSSGSGNLNDNRNAQIQQHVVTAQRYNPAETSNVQNGRDYIQVAGTPAVYQKVHQNDPYQQAHHDLINSGNTNFEKVVQNAGRGGGGNFQHGTLDLGTIGRPNVDQELQRTHFAASGHGDVGGRNRGGINGGISGGNGGGGGGGGGSSYSQSSYITGNPQTGYRQQSYYRSNGKPYYGVENEDFYDESNNRLGSGQQSQPQVSSPRRYKRAIVDPEPPTEDDKSPCQKAKCKIIRCVAKNLEKDNGVWIGLRTRMVAHTMEKLAGGLKLNVSSLAISQVTRLPYIGEPKRPIIKKHEIHYLAEPERTPIPDIVPLWIVVLAACIGALILLLLVFLLYKCGFFNRNRPNNHPERQPLRNGDEHL